MTELNKNYRKSVNAYMKVFEKKHDVEVDYIGNLGEVVEFCDIFCNFHDLKYSIDNNLKFDYISDWFYYECEYHEIAAVNFESYVKLRKDSEFKKGFNFKSTDFEKELLAMRLKSLKKKKAND